MKWNPVLSNCLFPFTSTAICLSKQISALVTFRHFTGKYCHSFSSLCMSHTLSHWRHDRHIVGDKLMTHWRNNYIHTHTVGRRPGGVRLIGEKRKCEIYLTSLHLGFMLFMNACGVLLWWCFVVEPTAHKEKRNERTQVCGGANCTVAHLQPTAMFLSGSKMTCTEVSFKLKSLQRIALKQFAVIHSFSLTFRMK